MSRFTEGDYDDETWALDKGRWERNSRATLKSKRGRKALALIREALLALPDKRLIEGAVCTVGGVDRAPEITDEEIDARMRGLHEAGLRDSPVHGRDFTARWMRGEREDVRHEIARSVERQGCGVCLNGALLWHLKVKAGMNPDEAFASLPTVISVDSGDPLDETAHLAANEAGIAFTLAWNLAYRNDETYRDKTPEERYAAFLAWIEAELAEDVAA